MSGFKLGRTVDGEAAARALASTIGECHEPTAVTWFRVGAGWRVEAYFERRPDLRVIASDLAAPPPPSAAEPIAECDWIALSQKGLPPVRAGRFVIYGSHDCGRIPRGPFSILIDAGTAFGTAHHATTEGCLLAIDRLARRRRFRRILDLGCGSGVLAIAAARANRGAIVVVSDADSEAVAVAVANARANGCALRISTVTASGFAHGRLRSGPPFDLILANILAEPLIKLAPAVARRTARGGQVVLSGVLEGEAPDVVAAYRLAGFRLLALRRIAGWATLELARFSLRPLADADKVRA